MPVFLSNVPAACHAKRTSVGPIGSLSSRSVWTAFLTATWSTGASAACRVMPTPAPTTTVAPAAPAKTERALKRGVTAREPTSRRQECSRPKHRTHSWQPAHPTRENPKAEAKQGPQQGRTKPRDTEPRNGGTTANMSSLILPPIPSTFLPPHPPRCRPS